MELLLYRWAKCKENESYDFGGCSDTSFCYGFSLLVIIFFPMFQTISSLIQRHKICTLDRATGIRAIALYFGLILLITNN